MVLYQLDNVTQTYGDRPVLTIDQWSVAPNTITGLCGPNGSGKSTLLKLLGFIERPSRGDIRFNGKKADPHSPAVRRNVALLPQSAYLLKRSVAKNIAYGLRIRKARGNESAQVRQALDWVGLDPDQFMERPWYALSGGEAQRVALAARLVLSPQVLLLDEPTTSVDAASAQRIKEAAVNAHRQWGTSLIIASHDMGWLQEICHDMVYLFQGRLFAGGQRTLVFGPWRPLEGGAYGKKLSDTQPFVVTRPPADPDHSVAIVDPARLTLHRTSAEIPQGWESLAGTVSALRLDRLSGKVCASILVGQTEFTVNLPNGSDGASGVQPGARVWIGYDPQDIQWF